MIMDFHSSTLFLSIDLVPYLSPSSTPVVLIFMIISNLAMSASCICSGGPFISPEMPALVEKRRGRSEGGRVERWKDPVKVAKWRIVNRVSIYVNR